MSTKRRILRRSSRPSTQFSAVALEAFRKLHATECTCPEPDWAGKYWESPIGECPGCKTWWEQHSILLDELRPLLRLTLRDFPVVQHPNARSPYPADHYNSKHWWRPDLEAQARYCALAEAAGIDLDLEEEEEDATEEV